MTIASPHHMDREDRMTRREIARRFGAMALAMLSSSCFMLRSWTYRYRLTVVLSQGDKEYSGSGVIQVTRNLGVGGIGAKVKGEAITIQTSQKKFFSLLVSKELNAGWSYAIAHRVFANRLGTPAVVDEIALDRLERLIGEKADVQPEDYPAVVWFKDTDNPASIEVLDPIEISAGGVSAVRIKRVQIEITDDPVTKGLENHLPWVVGLTGKLDKEHKLNPQDGEKDLVKSAFMQGM